tara:strand:+ start:1284 stop:1556 length:273 start_codon:yes stop_codon:yes gene_type:complete
MDKEKASYYERNKEARCAYQREYYKKNKDRINRKRQIDEATDPEKAERRLEYNRAYYRKHRERLLKRRAERYRKLKAEKQIAANSGDMQI